MGSDSVSAKPNHTGNTITVNYNGSVAEAFISQYRSGLQMT